MKTLFSIFFFFLFLCLNAQETEINGCTVTSYYGNETHIFEAYGNVYVETNPKEPVDLYVKIVNTPQRATYNVYRSSDKPIKCGEWRFVTDRNKAKFTIRYVKEQDWFEDCRIYFTNDRSQAGY